MTVRSYDMLAIDLDGTLLDSRGEVSERNVRALGSARDAGVRVVVCTGRGLVESRHILRTIDQRDPVVVAGGAIIADPVTSRTLHRFAISADLVTDTVERVLAHGHPALVLKDPAEAGFDYLVVQGRERLAIDPVTRWWFDKLRVQVRFASGLHEDAHPEHTVRVGACGLSSRLLRIKRALEESSNGRTLIHSFPAVVAAEHAAGLPEGESMHVLEMFDAAANKWSAISRLAAQWGIGAARVAAIGDEINDISMLRGAGLGVAMGNAVPAARDAARQHTLGNNEDGVAHAIERILSGEW